MANFCFRIDNIELNISSVAVDTASASQELTTAAEYQRRAGKRAACLMLVLAVVVAIVLLAVSQILTYAIISHISDSLPFLGSCMTVVDWLLLYMQPNLNDLSDTVGSVTPCAFGCGIYPLSLPIFYLLY